MEEVKENKGKPRPKGEDSELKKQRKAQIKEEKKVKIEKM